jgi:hypothetical protein
VIKHTLLISTQIAIGRDSLMKRNSLSASLISLGFMALVLIYILSGCAFVVRIPSFKVDKTKRPENLFRGVFHVHSEYSHDSHATLEHIVQTARDADLDFVVVTDHNFFKNVRATDHRPLLAHTAYQKIKKPDDPLLVFTSEISTESGHVIALGIKEEPPDLWHKEKVLSWIEENGGHPIIAHPFSAQKPWTQLYLKQIDGVEIYSFADVYYERNTTDLILKGIFLPPKFFLEAVAASPDKALRYWDERLESQPVNAFGAADAHIRWIVGGFPIENLLLYFQSVTTYAWADTLHEENILEALIKGRSFIAFEYRGVAQSFSFEAKTKEKSFLPGSMLTLSDPIVLQIKLPETADVRLIHNGKVMQREIAKSITHQVKEAGVYRVEVYKKEKIWIISNPIYVEQ